MYTQFSFFCFKTILFLGIIVLSACSTPPDTLQYHETIQSEVSKVRDDYLHLSELIGSRDEPAIKSKINALQSSVVLSIDELKKVPKIKNDFNYKPMAIRLLEVLEDNLKKRYPKLIEMIGIADPSDEQATQIEQLYEEIEDEEEPLFEQFEQASVSFLTHYKIKENSTEE